MDLSLLHQIGLTEGEIKVYQALFKLGSTSTGPLIKEAKVHASKIYSILERLIDKGLVSFIKEGKKTIYSANPAKTIISYLDQLQNNIVQQKQSAEQLIKELEVLKELGGKKSEATIFRGTKGLKTAYLTAIEKLKPNEEVYSMFLPAVKPTLLLFFKNLITQVSKKKATHYLLYNEHSPEIDSIKNLPNLYFKIGVSADYKAPAEMCVYGEYTIISTSGGEDQITFLIKDKTIAESFKHQFKLIWNQQAKTYFGLEGVKAVFNDSLDYKEIFLIGGNWGIIKYYEDFFNEWNQEREKKKVIWYDLVDAEFLIKKYNEPTELKYYEIKTLPEQVTSPAVIFIYGEKVATILWKEETLINLIENKEIAIHYKKYFNYLWEQEVFVSHGTKGLQNIHEKTYKKLKPGEEYVYLGIPKYQPEEHHRYWKKDHERRVKAGIKCRLLFNKDTDKKILAQRNSYKGCDARYMPTNIQTPSYLNIFKDTVMISLPKKDPIVIEIKNQEIADSFKAYFEDFWKQTKPFKA